MQTAAARLSCLVLDSSAQRIKAMNNGTTGAALADTGIVSVIRPEADSALAVPSGGPPAAVLEAARAGRIMLLTSAALRE
jgi:hypothetical protein